MSHAALPPDQDRFRSTRQAGLVTTLMLGFVIVVALVAIGGYWFWLVSSRSTPTGSTGGATPPSKSTASTPTTSTPQATDPITRLLSNLPPLASSMPWGPVQPDTYTYTYYDTSADGSPQGDAHVVTLTGVSRTATGSVSDASQLPDGQSYYSHVQQANLSDWQPDPWVQAFGAASEEIGYDKAFGTQKRLIVLAYDTDFGSGGSPQAPQCPCSAHYRIFYSDPF